MIIVNCVISWLSLFFACIRIQTKRSDVWWNVSFWLWIYYIQCL